MFISKHQTKCYVLLSEIHTIHDQKMFVCIRGTVPVTTNIGRNIPPVQGWCPEGENWQLVLSW